MFKARRSVGVVLGIAIAALLVPPAWSATPGPGYSWGTNADGRTGLGTDGAETTTPTAILSGQSLGAFTLIDAGVNHACALGEDGSAYCWGWNGSGQLGNGTRGTTDDSVPRLVAGGRVYSSITAGNSSSCALTDDTGGNAYCWGSNSNGQLGNGTRGTTDDSVPRLVTGGRTFSSMSVGLSSVCAVADDDSAYCWGQNDFGQLGNGTLTDDSVPRLVAGGHSFAEVSSGERFACGVAGGGSIYCWGFNDYGKLGNGTLTDDSVPRLVAGIRAYSSVSAGKDHACGISTDDSVYCWGLNDNGQLGIGSTDDSVAVPTRVPIPQGAPVRSISAGFDNSCAVTDDTTYCWGANNNGQLGIGSTGAPSRLPVAVTLAALSPGNSPAQVTSGEQYNSMVAVPRMIFSGTGFPGAQVGQTTSTTVTVRHGRPWDVTVTSVTATGPGVSVTGGTCSGALVGSDCTVVLTWSPSSAGALSGATLTVTYAGVVGLAATVQTSTANLTGTASNPPPIYSPSPPRDVTAVSGDASAVLTWSAPADAGSFPVTTYQVTSSPDGKTCMVAALTCTITGLTNGTTYTFTAKALNGAGWSAPSSPSNAVTPAAPPEPTIVIAGSREGSMIRVVGTTTDLVGTVAPWIRFPGQTRFTEGTARPAINDDTFTWSRKANKRATVYFVHEWVTSNTVRFPAR